MKQETLREVITKQHSYYYCRQYCNAPRRLSPHKTLIFLNADEENSMYMMKEDLNNEMKQVKLVLTRVPVR